MGAIIMSALVSVIAIVGGFRTRKRRGRICDCQPFGGVVLLKYIYGQPFCIIFLLMGRKC